MTVTQGSVGTARTNSLGFNPCSNLPTHPVQQATYHSSTQSGQLNSSCNINVAFSRQNLPKVTNPAIRSGQIYNINLAVQNNSPVPFAQKPVSTNYNSVTLDIGSAVRQQSSTSSPAPSYHSLQSSQVPSTPTSSSPLQHSRQSYLLPHSSTPSPTRDHFTYSPMAPVKVACLAKEDQYPDIYDTNAPLNNTLHTVPNVPNRSNSMHSIDDSIARSTSSTFPSQQLQTSDNVFKSPAGKLPAFDHLTYNLLHSSGCCSPDELMNDPALSLQSDPPLRSSSSSSTGSSLSSESDSCFDEPEEQRNFTDLMNGFGFGDESAMELDLDPNTNNTDELEFLMIDTFPSSYSDFAIPKMEPMDDHYFGGQSEALNVQPSEDMFSRSQSQENSDSDYDSDQQGSSSIQHQNYYDAPFPDHHRPAPLLQVHSQWPRQLSPVSDEGFVEGTSLSISGNFPDFDKIQHASTEAERSPPSRRTSASPKEKRKSTSSPQVADKERRKPGRKPGQVSNVLHLWEFMRDLLHSEDSKGIIEWISKSEGVFRVVNSTEVARLWGKKKKNKKEMTYEKLSRSLRYSRLEGYFSNLPKDKNYPKKLCFKFGPKSKDWY